MDPLRLRKLTPKGFSGSVTPAITSLRIFYDSLKALLFSIGIWYERVYTRSEIEWSPIFPFKAVASWSNPRALKCWGSAGIRDLHNGYVVEFFPNVEGRNSCVRCLLDICCGNSVLKAPSVGKEQQDGGGGASLF